MDGFAEIIVNFLPTENGGRRTAVSLSTDEQLHYRPHIRVQNGDGEMLGVEFVDGPDEPIQPGGGTYATIRFAYEPNVCYDALIVGVKFDVMEGARVERQVRRITHRWASMTSMPRALCR